MSPDTSNLPLRDPHLPDPIAWWPPAPGWWIVATLLLLLPLLFWWLRRRLRRGRLGRAALAELRRLEGDYDRQPDNLALTRGLSLLLRRLTLSLYPRAEVAALTGEAWLRLLDQPLQGTIHADGFTKGAGRALAEAPYNPKLQVDGPALLRLTRAWIEQSAADAARGGRK